MAPKKVSRFVRFCKWFFFRVPLSLFPLALAALMAKARKQPDIITLTTSNGQLLLIATGIGITAIAELLEVGMKNLAGFKWPCVGFCLLGILLAGGFYGQIVSSNPALESSIVTSYSFGILMLVGLSSALLVVLSKD